MNTNRQRNTSNSLLRNLAVSAPAFVLVAALAGCSGGALPGTFGTGSAPTTTHFSGNVHGGQQPISGATIQLYTVGTSGLKSASTGLIAATVLTDANGNFDITGQYSCGSATDVYLVASGGDPGNGTNANVSMVAALGSCANLLANAATTFISINEASTVAAAYALAPFASDVTHVGASGSFPTGLVNAFATVNDLYNLRSGSAGGASLAQGATVPVTEINTLSNILAACVNTTGAASSQCTTLFSATGVTDTFNAALAIAQNPGSAAITNLFVLSSSTAPFQPSLNTQPNDFSIAVNYTANSGLSTPYGIAIDASGNAWVTNESASNITALSPSGAVLFAPTTTGLIGAQGIAVDTSNNVWVANTAGNSVMEFISSGNYVSSSNFVAGITAPTAIALDSAGSVFVTNYNSNSVAIFSASNGTPASGSPFTAGGSITVPSGIAIDASGNALVTNGNGSVVKLSNAGALVSTYTDSALQGPVSVAIDASGDIFLTGSTTGNAVAGAVSEFSSTGTASGVSPVSSGVTSPSGVASDGTSVWVANSIAGGSLARFIYGSATSASPTAGFGSLNTPVGVAVDASGNVWTANSGNNSVTKFVGLANPVKVPLVTNVGP